MGFYVFSIFISYYGLLMSIGVIISFLVGIFLVRKFSLDINEFFLIYSVVGLGAILGAKLLFFIIKFDNIDLNRLLDLKYISILMNSGFVFFGGLIGGFISLIILKYILKIDINKYINIFIPLVPFLHGFGRIGCNCVGCCYGIRFNSYFSRIYKFSQIAPNNVALFPVQLVESIFNFILFFILFYRIIKNTEYKIKNLEIYLFSYSIIRFILEFFRGDTIERGKILFVSTSQFICIIIFLSVTFYCIYKNKKRVV